MPFTQIIVQQVDVKTSTTVLAILSGKGGLGDVGRHAILAALERNDVASHRSKSFHNIQNIWKKRITSADA